MWNFFKKKEEVKKNSFVRSLVGIRLEAIGGQGANSAGKILAEAAVIGMGYTGNHFSSFGSEKRGTPVRSFVKFSTKKLPVRSATTIINPDLLVIFHEALLEHHSEILDGSTEKTDLIINTSKKSENIIFNKLVNFNRIVTINATEISMKEKCGLNAVMLGAITTVLDEVSDDLIQKTLQNFFSNRSEEIIQNNLNGFLQGKKLAKINFFKPNKAIENEIHQAFPDLGWANAPLGGVIINPGNSVLKDHSSSRKGIAPQFISEICFNCGYCDMVCPDFCFVWDLDLEKNKNPILKGIDYQYCKGCQKCIAVCPVGALRPVQESQIPTEEKQQKLFPDVNSEHIENKWKKMDWAYYSENLSENEKILNIQNELLNIDSYLKPQMLKIDVEKKRDK